MSTSAALGCLFLSRSPHPIGALLAAILTITGGCAVEVADGAVTSDPLLACGTVRMNLAPGHCQREGWSSASEPVLVAEPLEQDGEVCFLAHDCSFFVNASRWSSLRAEEFLTPEQSDELLDLGYEYTFDVYGTDLASNEPAPLVQADTNT